VDILLFFNVQTYQLDPQNLLSIHISLSYPNHNNSSNNSDNSDNSDSNNGGDMVLH